MSANMLSAATLAAALVVVRVHADVYMHNPRGSNDRNCERNVNRNNGNRLFDSQNNAKGGYACPRAVGPAEMQDEDGVAGFGGFDQDKKMYVTTLYSCYACALLLLLPLLLLLRPPRGYRHHRYYYYY